MTTTPSDVVDTSKPLLNVIARFRAPTATSKRTLVCSAAGVLSELYNRAVSESNPGVVVLTIPGSGSAQRNRGAESSRHSLVQSLVDLRRRASRLKTVHRIHVVYTAGQCLRGMEEM